MRRPRPLSRAACRRSKRRFPPCRGLSLGRSIKRHAPAGLLARGSKLHARLPRFPQWLPDPSDQAVHVAHRSQLQGQPRCGSIEVSTLPCSRLSPCGHRRDLRDTRPRADAPKRNSQGSQWDMARVVHSPCAVANRVPEHCGRKSRRPPAGLGGVRFGAAAFPAADDQDPGTSIARLPLPRAISRPRRGGTP